MTDIEVIEVNSRLFVVSTSGAYGSLLSWEWQNGNLVYRNQVSQDGTASLPAPGGLAPIMMDGAPGLVSYGGAGQGVDAYSLTATGHLRFEGEMGAGAVTFDAMLVMETAADTYVFGDARGTDGLTMWRLEAHGGLTEIEQLPVGLAGDGPHVPDLAHWHSGGRDYLESTAKCGAIMQPFRFLTKISAPDTIARTWCAACHRAPEFGFAA